MFQTNADFLINQLTKYFYTRHLTLVLYFKRKFRSPSLNTLKISIFYSIFTCFHSGWGVLYFQRNTNFVIIEWNINNFAQETLYLPFISEKIGAVRRKHFSNIHFLPQFHYFQQRARFVIFQMNTDFLINQLQKYLYTKHPTLLFHSNKKFVLSITKGFRKINFLPHFYLISQRMRCAIFEINTDIVKVYEHINIFTQETL